MLLTRDYIAIAEALAAQRSKLQMFCTDDLHIALDALDVFIIKLVNQLQVDSPYFNCEEFKLRCNFGVGVIKK